MQYTTQWQWITFLVIIHLLHKDLVESCHRLGGSRVPVIIEVHPQHGCPLVVEALEPVIPILHTGLGGGLTVLCRVMGLELETKLRDVLQSRKSVFSSYILKPTGWPVCHDMKQGSVNQVF